MRVPLDELITCSSYDLARHNNFRNAVLGQKLAVAGPAGKQLFYAAVGKRTLNGKRLRQLHLHIVAGGEMKTAVNRLLARGARMAERQHLAARIHGRMQPSDNWSDQPLRQIVECGPKKHHIEHAPGKTERLFKEAFHIPDGLSVFVGAGGPLAGAGIVDQVGQENTVSQAGEVIDVRRRSIANVNDAQAGLALQPLAHLRPAARVPRNSRPRESGSGSGRAAVLLLFEPTA